MRVNVTRDLRVKDDAKLKINLNNSLQLRCVMLYILSLRLHVTPFLDQHR